MEEKEHTFAAFATEVRPIVHLCVKEAFCTSFRLPGKVMRSGRRLVSGTSGATPRSRKACQAPAPGARSRIHTQTSNLFTPKPFKPPILSLFPTTHPKPQPVLSPPLAPTPLPYLSLRGTLSDFRDAPHILYLRSKRRRFTSRGVPYPHRDLFLVIWGYAACPSTPDSEIPSL